ncbi:hypothetical protein GFY24_14460 [Nocardia sp. SYP-A9097]|uniref:hypothetical protein n=1 Tax=Nocardia sp. SYP-A9097 TaxID=2663237 RepID=UPI00129C0D9E|nr:hypothetical protein [Nocardia sp. SYP-A9097]MRH88631.1 hypothetical protein [Nocardia sp. SYP-A9097]
MYEQLKVGTWACVDDQCPIRPVVHPEDSAVTLVFGDHNDFELLLSATALQNLLQQGTDALNRLASDHPRNSL